MKTTLLPEKITSSFAFKLVAIGILSLFLLIPLGWVQGLIFQRKSTHQEVRQEVASTWSGDQTIKGPVLNIPVRRQFANGRQVDAGVLRVLPEKYHTTGDLESKILKRSIHEVVTYTAELDLEATFSPRRYFEDGLIYRTKEAYVTLGVSDIQGFSSDMQMSVNGRKVAGVSARDGSSGWSGVQFPVDASTELKVSTHVGLNGSDRFQWTPVGKVSELKLESDWPSPSFVGGRLPHERSISKDGFTASWKVLELNRGCPQSWMNGGAIPSLDAMGVELIEPVDHYAKSHRSAKYGLLFIILTFAIFLIGERMVGANMHTAKYILVGAAVCTFYLLLVALSEHVSFNISFIVASLAVIFLNMTYFYRELRNVRSTVIATATMGLLYGYLFVLLQLEDHALLAGSIGLFIILFFLIWLTSSKRIEAKLD